MNTGSEKRWRVLISARAFTMSVFSAAFMLLFAGQTNRMIDPRFAGAAVTLTEKRVWGKTKPAEFSTIKLQ